MMNIQYCVAKFRHLSLKPKIESFWKQYKLKERIEHICVYVQTKMLFYFLLYFRCREYFKGFRSKRLLLF